MRLIYYKELDGVRGIAALMVMMLHFFGQGLYRSVVWSPVLKLSVIGQTGVDLFFVLSGFLITRILLDTKEKEGYFKNFYMRRTLRIFPLYFGFLSLTYFIIPLIKGDDIPELNSQIFHWTYLQNFAMTFQWNYSGPEHFYLIWPLLVFLLSRKQLQAVIFLILASAFVTRVVLITSGYEMYYFTFARMDTLALGGLLAIVEHKSLLNRIKPVVMASLAILVSVPTIFLFLMFGGEGNGYIQVLKPVLIGLFFLFTICYVIISTERSMLKKQLRSQFLVYAGKVSYGLYVYHPICFGFYSSYLKSGSIFLDLIGSFLLSFIVASLSFYFFENKLLLLKKHFEFNKPKENKNLVTF